jgi:hypothetical protein
VRNRLDFPAPDAPAISRRSPGARSSAATVAIGSPVGSRTTRSSIEKSLVAELLVTSAAPARSGWSTSRIASSNCATRFITARHSAILA